MLSNHGWRGLPACWNSRQHRKICSCRNSYLYNLWMKAVFTIFGCEEDVAAAAVRELLCDALCEPVVSVALPLSKVWCGSTSGLLLFTGGPMELDAVGVMSIGSLCVGEDDFGDEGFCCRTFDVPFCCRSPEIGPGPMINHGLKVGTQI